MWSDFMSILKVFTVYDSKSDAYMQPFFMQTKGQAVRAFSDTVNDPKHQFYKHAEDFTLFELGSFDELSALFDLHLTPVSLGCAIEYKKQQVMSLQQQGEIPFDVEA